MHTLMHVIHTSFSLSPVVYVCRNPNDTSVSFFHHNKDPIYGMDGTFEDFSKFFKNDQLMFGGYWNHLKVIYISKLCYLYIDLSILTFLFIIFQSVRLEVQRSQKLKVCLVRGNEEGHFQCHWRTM
jgi:hypothetical protein